MSRADVERRGAGRPVARAFLAANRPPREGGAGEAELRGALAGEVERRVPPAQRVAGGLRRGVCQHRQDEALGVPERVPVVAGPGQALRRDRALLGARAGLKRVEEREAHRLLQLGVALELDVGAIPERRRGSARWSGDEPVPAGVPRLGERGDDLVAERRSERRLDHA